VHRHSGAEDFVILSPVGSRSPADVEPLIGDFLNLVALRCDVSGDPTFAALCREYHQTEEEIQRLRERLERLDDELVTRIEGYAPI